MKKTVTIQTEIAEVKEVHSTFDAHEANDLIKSGKWLLLHGSVAHKDALGYQALPCWLLGRIE